MLNSIIDSKKITFIFEDTGLEDKQQIINAPTSIESILSALKEHHHNVVVLSRKEKREEIFEIAMKLNLLVEFETTTKLRNENVDISMFENKVVVFDKAFDGTTSTTNNTYKNIQRIIEISEKFVAIDTIGTKYLISNYFPGTINLIDKNFQVDYTKIENVKYMNQLLLDKFVILKDNNVLNEISDNYWSPGYSASYSFEETVNNSIKNTIKNEVSVQHGWSSSSTTKYSRSKDKINLDYKVKDYRSKTNGSTVVMWILITVAIVIGTSFLALVLLLLLV